MINQYPLSFRTNYIKNKNNINSYNYGIKTLDEIHLTLIAKSVIEHNDQNSLCYKIISENLKTIEDEDLDVESNNFPDLKYDSIGASLIHQLYKYEKYEIGRWIIKKYPEYSLEPYSNLGNESGIMPFTGQNLLHTTILQKNYEETKWLLDFYSRRSLKELEKLLMGKTIGSYYRYNNKFYFGQTPLHFAVSMCNTEIVDLIISYITQLNNDDLIFLPDENGNNIIHLSVLQNSISMYEHIKMRFYDIIEQELSIQLHKNISNILNTNNNLRYYIPKKIDVKKYMENFKGYMKIPNIIFYPDKILEFVIIEDIDNIKELLKIINNILDNNNDSEIFKKLLNKLFFKIQFISTNYEKVQPSPRTTNYLDQFEKLLKCKITQKKSSRNILDNKISKFYDNSEKNLEMISNKFYENKNEIIDQLSTIKFFLENWIFEKEKWMKRIINQWLFGENDGVVKQLFDDRFMLCFNIEGYNPITLSATNKKKEIFLHLIKETIIPRQKFGEYDNYIIDLSNIEYFPPIEDNTIIEVNSILKYSYEYLYYPIIPNIYTKNTVLNLICKKNMEEMLDIYEIKTLMNEKWNKLGKPLIMKKIITNTIFTLSIIILTCIANKNNNNDIILLLITTAYSFIIGFLNIKKYFTLVSNPMSFNLKGSGLFDYIFDKIVNLLFLSILVSRSMVYFLKLNFYIYEILLGFCTFFSLIYSFLYLMAYYDDFGKFLITVIHILHNDFIYFSKFYIRIIIMFGFMFKTITDDVDDNGFIHSFRCMWELVRLSLQIETGEINYLEMQYTNQSHIFLTLMFLFQLLVNVLLLNLLIAVINNTYNNYGLNSEIQLRVQRHHLLIKLLNSFDKQEFEYLADKYSHKFYKKPIYKMNSSSLNIFGKETTESSVKRYFEIRSKNNFIQETQLVVKTSKKNNSIFLNSDSDLANIFKNSFWVDINNNHPSLNQIITYNDFNTKKWIPKSQDKLPFCRYILSKDNIKIVNSTKKILLIIHPQNDFCDKLPLLFNIKSKRVGLQQLNNSDYNFDITINDVEFNWKKNLFSVKVLIGNEILDGKLINIREKKEDESIEYYLEIFMNDDKYNNKGSLSVLNSYSDSLIISKLIHSKWDEYDEIIISRDCHKKFHISNKWFWKAGNDFINTNENVDINKILHPKPFQLITYKDVLNKIWIPTDPNHYDYCLFYTHELEVNNKYTHTIWEDHCIIDYFIEDNNINEINICKNHYLYDHNMNSFNIESQIDLPKFLFDDLNISKNYGFIDKKHNLNLDDYNEKSSLGFDIMHEVKIAINFWKKQWATVKSVNKNVEIVDIGFNIFTETYSILKSEVENKKDPLTSLNFKLLEKINSPDTKLHICGEALSHVVKSSIEDIILLYTNQLKNIVIITNCTSSINNSNYIKISKSFLNNMVEKGILLRNFINNKLVDVNIDDL
jgi:nicotinamidase-related amidase